MRSRRHVVTVIAAAALLLAASPAAAVGFRDSFNRPNGPIGPGYTEYKGAWLVRSRQAAVARAAPFSYATVHTGLSMNYRVDVDLALSPTRLRADAGLVTLYKDRANQLFCKVEVTRDHTGGFLTIGHLLPGDNNGLLSYRTNVGVRNGRTYHMRLVRDRRDVACTISGRDLGRSFTVRHRLTAAELDAFGKARRSGLRARITRREDDGGTRWDNFTVTPLR
jgi:hypothetical protein